MCMLIDELRRLKKSSYDAVDNDKDFNCFKEYMHVHREVETDLIKTINQAQRSDKKSLILVCGNVGDGKSHLISYLKHHENNYLNGFTVHNDATESRSRYLDEKQELSRVLKDFRDDTINNDSHTKVIVAINLGVLSNFINSEEGREFSKLAAYVNDKKILIDTDMLFSNDENDVFYHVNFGDYHIYRLNSGFVESPYISSIIDKISSNCMENDFYQAYFNCNFCAVCDKCPIKHNYEMLRVPVVKQGLINIIVETVIKDKLIISTRELLDFFYDIIVHPNFEVDKYAKSKGEKQIKDYISYSMPSILYEHDDISSFLSHVKKYDFNTQRTEVFDEIITRFNTTEHLNDMFDEYIEHNPCTDYIRNYDIDRFSLKDTCENKEIFMQIFLLFSRMCKLATKEGTKFNTVNLEFSEFISDLYYGTKKDKSKVKNLYAMVRKCIFLWNGSSDDGIINLNTNNEDYILSTELNITPNLSGYSEVLSQDIFDRFSATINVSFSLKSDVKKCAAVSIDYDLYKMMKKIVNGYRPTTKDNSYFAGFVSFINKLSALGDSNECIVIKHFICDEIKEYSLKCDEFGAFEFKEVL